jgi:hypothetical protein
MNYEKRIQRVKRLYNQAIEDGQTNKVMQGYYLMTLLLSKQVDAGNVRKKLINGLRNY